MSEEDDTYKETCTALYIPHISRERSSTFSSEVNWQIYESIPWPSNKMTSGRTEFSGFSHVCPSPSLRRINYLTMTYRVRVISYARARFPERAVQLTKLCRSELAANDILRRYYAPQPFLLRHRVLILRHCAVFVTNFTAAEFQGAPRQLGVCRVQSFTSDIPTRMQCTIVDCRLVAVLVQCKQNAVFLFSVFSLRGERDKKSYKLPCTRVLGRKGCRQPYRTRPIDIEIPSVHNLLRVVSSDPFGIRSHERFRRGPVPLGDTGARCHSGSKTI
ncbi:hypothetical protein EVAR_17563_1 [Eumeta japonica]|uniref:Uncharacterized protein n=1 Tax=Eumeta variegata TaxID=151549 RepID=A0A4C1UDA6_EUMVA|nr:hypothetical protein EVAR_17563_1 [Eumeta japonica]